MSAPVSHPPLIPRALFFDHPRYLNPQLSPDGRYLSYIAPDHHNVPQLWLRTFDRADDQLMTTDTQRGIQRYFWLYDGIHLAYLQDAHGDEHWHLYAVNISTRAVRDLTPFPNSQAQLLARSPHRPNELLIGLNLHDSSTHDVYRVVLSTGELLLDTKYFGNVVEWIADPALQVRAAIGSTPDGGYDLFVRKSVEESWSRLHCWQPDDVGWQAAFTADGHTLYILSSVAADTARLIAHDLRTGGEQVLAADPAYDIQAMLLHPITSQLEAVWVDRERPEWQACDPHTAAQFAQMVQTFGPSFDIISRDLANQRWLIGVIQDTAPLAYYVYAQRTQTSTPLFSQQPSLDSVSLAPMRPIVYHAHDGLPIHGYVTLPMASTAEPLPTVVLVHGGPWSRDSWGFHRLAQWLANRGYAVAQFNFRGSTGYGKAFLNAGNREWGRAMQMDLIDGVEWLTVQHIADPERIAIMGGSYGGYAALVGLAQTPTIFAAGIALCGVSDLVGWLKSLPPYWETERAIFTRRIGDPDVDAAMLQAHSPRFFVSQIVRPLLLGQAANDVRARMGDSQQMVEALRQAGKSVVYIEYAGEGHAVGMWRPANRLHFYAQTEAFLATYLGGRVEPLDPGLQHTACIE
jgi:dipeptidyl aminopeptidase/acylaminoacyl peptidase